MLSVSMKNVKAITHTLRVKQGLPSYRYKICKICKILDPTISQQSQQCRNFHVRNGCTIQSNTKQSSRTIGKDYGIKIYIY